MEEEYQIKPWATPDDAEPGRQSIDWDLQVPPEIDQLAEIVMQQYEMRVSGRTLITSKPDKGGAIWQIETDKGPRSLKLLHRNPERSLFSVGLQDYVVKQGARVPALIPAKDGKLFVEKGGKLWIVTDWIALEPATKVDLSGAQELCYGLGEFHRHTKGYIPPVGAKNSSRLYRWPNHYQKIIKKIGWMRELASAYRDTQASAAILEVADRYETQAKEALTRLQQSAYPQMVAMGEPYWGLVHQDYGWSNGQKGPGGLWVIDLDGVSYDLPFRDLRKLITSTMDDMGVWDLDWIRGMIDAYHQANPLDLESYEVLLIDMAMPNEFYKHLKEMFFDPVTFLNTEATAILQRVVATDETKYQALSELERDKAKYKHGNYSPLAVPAPAKKESAASGAKDSKWTLVPGTGKQKSLSETSSPAKQPRPARKAEEPVAAAFASPPEEDKQTAQKPFKQRVIETIEDLIAQTKSNYRQKRINIIDLLPYTRKNTDRTTKSRTPSKKSEETAKIQTASKKSENTAKSRTASTAMQMWKQSSPMESQTGDVLTAATEAAQKQRNKVAKSKRPIASARTEKREKRVATAKKASRTAASRRRNGSNKLSAPRLRNKKHPVRKRSAARGRKKPGGSR